MDIVDKLKASAIEGLYQAEDLLMPAAAEIEKLREIIELIAIHPVEETKMWEQGSKEMLRLARAAASEWEWQDHMDEA